MIFLHDHGVGTSRAVRIYKTYGADAIAAHHRRIPTGSPRDIRGIGFLTADKIAAKLGIAKDALVRARAGIGYALMRGDGRRALRPAAAQLARGGRRSCSRWPPRASTRRWPPNWQKAPSSPTRSTERRACS